jgi:Predicted Zn peptidase
MKITRIDRNNDNTPILSNKEIDDFAYSVLKDYSPELLNEPGIIDYERFIESYMEMELLYKDIYYKEDTPPIYGITVFRDSTVKVFDRENCHIAHPIIRANTVILDNYVTGNDGMAMFTALHESGHIFLHQGVFSIFRAGQVCCRTKNTESTLSNKSKWTAEESRERQANHFAGAIAMPNATFIPFVNKELREYGLFKGSIVLGYDDDWDIIAKDLMPERISETYGVSKQAALIKLKKCGFVIANKQT